MTAAVSTTKARLSSLNTTGGTNALALPDADVSRPRTRAAGLTAFDIRLCDASGPSKRGDLPVHANQSEPVATPYPLRTSPVPATSLLVSAARSTLDDLTSDANPAGCVIEPFNRGRTSRGVLPGNRVSAPRIPVADLSCSAHLITSVSDPHKDGDRDQPVHLETTVPIPHHASDLAYFDTRRGGVAGPFTVADRAKGATRYSSVGNPSLAGDRIRPAALSRDVPGTTNPASDQMMNATRFRHVACPF